MLCYILLRAGPAPTEPCPKRSKKRMAPEVGFEPTIYPSELLRDAGKRLYERIREPWDN